MGRLKPGVTLEQAKARLQASAAEYRQKFPNALGPNNSFSVEPLREAIVSDVRSSLLVLVGAVSFVLLIACANVANLLLVRATGRRREIAIRAAIGAGRGRIIRQLLTESVVLSLVGGVLGLVLGVVGIRALLAINTAGLPRVGEDGALVGARLARARPSRSAVSLGTGILFGLIPALQGSRADLNVTLKESSGRSGTGFRQNKARSVLVVVEVALALVLLVGSALLIRTVDRASGRRSRLRHGQRADDADVADGAAVPRVGGRRADGPRRRRALQAIPGVEHRERHLLRAARGRLRPAVHRSSAGRCEGPFHGGGGWMTVSPGYFEVFKIPVKRGRAFTERDTRNAPPVVIINEAMAKQFWPKGDPLNDRLDHRPRRDARVRRRARAPDHRRRRRHARRRARTAIRSPTMFIPQAQVPDAANALNVRLTPIAWVVRTKVEPHSLSAAGPGAAAPGDRPAGVRHPHDGRGRLALDVARALQHVADDGVRRRRRCCWRRSASTA